MLIARSSQGQLQVWWYYEMEEAVKESRMAFATAHRIDEDRQADISAF